MDAKTLLPLIDFVFLTLGAILALITQMQVLRTIPINVSDVDAAAVMTPEGPMPVVAVTAAGEIWVGEQRVELGNLVGELGEVDRVLLRVDENARSEAPFEVIAALHAAGIDSEIQVEASASPLDR